MLGQISGDIRKIFASYEKEIALMEDSLRGLFASNIFLIPTIGRYLTEGGGKRMRPLFLLISARLAGYEGRNHIPLSSVMESIHTASLLHDDVVDGADVRRGRSAAHVTWGNQVVVLVGDFLYANALKTAVSCGDIRIVGALSQAVTAMSEGELLQLEKSGDVDITEDDYMRIISSKTGVLISTACRIGAILGHMPPGQEEALAAFGLKAGLTFQMADDILDYVADGGNGFGKKLGKDLEEGKITLPLIYLIRQAGAGEKAEIKTIIEGNPSQMGLDRIRELFKKYDAVELALERARQSLTEAKAQTAVLPDCGERQELLALADYALQREF